MATAFTSYKDLLEKMKGDLASDAWRTLSGYSVNGRSFTYRTFDDWLKIYRFVQDQAALEEGKAPYRGRMFAGVGGR